MKNIAIRLTHRSMRRIALFAVMSAGPVFGWAVNIEVTCRKVLNTMNASSGATMRCEALSPDFADITSGSAAFRDKKSTGYLELGIEAGKRFECYPEYRRVEVSFTVTYTTLNSWSCTSSGSTDTTRSVDVHTLTVDFDPDNQVVYTEKARILFDDAYFIRAGVLSVTMYDDQNNVVFSGTGFSSLPSDLYFETGIQTERYYNFTYSHSPSNFEMTYHMFTDQIKFNWSSQTGAEYYEIEFMNVNDYSASGLNTPLSTGQIQTTFRNNASRVRVNATITEYYVPNIFERGYVVGRIRAIGIGNCPLFDKEIPGEWSFEQVPSGLFALNTMSSDHYLAVDRHEGHSGLNKNWKLSVSYAEEGKHKEIVEYADGSSRVRQNVTKLNSHLTEGVIVGETVYDHQGRPTVQILPAPVQYHILQYYANLNLETNSGNKFSREHFDVDAIFTSGCIPDAPQLSPNSGSSNYYSTSNPDQSEYQGYVPDAFEFPYTQVVYTPDNTGRIKVQSGVGADHHLGSGHETYYYYGKPSQAELDRLFGTNVGYRSHYQKNMMIDANGQVSISFVDMAGRTIATSLAGEPPVNTQTLRDDNGSPLYTALAETLNVSLLGDITSSFPNGEDNHLSTDGIVWSSTTPLLVETSQHYFFSYSIALVDYLDSCLNETCFDCVYDLEIDVLDACNVSLLASPYQIRLGGVVADTLCNESDQYSDSHSQNSAFDMQLDIGNYTVVKKLKLNMDVIAYYTEKYIENNECLLSWNDFFVMPDTMGCYYTCEDCLTDLGTEAAFISQYPGIPQAELEAIYAAKKKACGRICDNLGNDLCMAGYESMLRDMTPMGQYAAIDHDSQGNLIPAQDLLSIFFTPNFLPDYTNIAGDFQGITDSWRFPHYFDKGNPTSYLNSANEFYFDEADEPSKIYLDLDESGAWVPQLLGNAPIMTDASGSYTYPQYLANLADFVSAFEESWAKSLLVYHPEFEYLRECFVISSHTSSINSITYNTWEFDELLQNTVFNPTNMSDLLPSTEGTTFDLREMDPFFDALGNATFLGSSPFTTFNELFDFIADNFIGFSVPTPQIYNMHEAVYMNNNCNVSAPGFIHTTCTVPASNAGCIGSQADWDRLVGSYLSVKQRVLMGYLQFTMYNAIPKISNQCIGIMDYDIYNKPHSQWFWLPCHAANHFLYADKVPRFAPPHAINTMATFDPPPPTPDQLLAYGQQQLYQLTGKCPAAMDLQTLLHYIAADGSLQSTVVLNSYPYLMPVLREKLENINAGNVPNYTAAVNTGNNSLEWTFNTTEHLTLYLPVVYDWNDVQDVTNLGNVTFSAGTYSFTVHLQVLSGSQVEWVEIAGETTIQIGNCESELPKICVATQAAKDLKSLMAVLNDDAVLTDPNTSLDPTYASFVTTSLMYYLGGTAADYEWQHPSASTYELWNTDNGDHLQINITSGASTLASGSFIFHSISGDISTSATVTGTSNFILYGYSSAALQLVELAPDVIIEGTIVSSSGVPAFLVSECDDPIPADCQTNAHKRWFQLKNELQVDPYVASACIVNLSPSSLPSSFQLVSLVPDLSYSTDLVSSTHFILTVFDGTDSLVYTGEYCKPLRACGDCEDIGDEPVCDNMYYTLSLANCLISPSRFEEGAILTFSLPSGLSECYPALAEVNFQPNAEMQPPFTFPDILEQWSVKLNSQSDGTYSAFHAPGSTSLIINLDGLSLNECECMEEGQNGHLIVTLGTDTLCEDHPENTCCIDYTNPEEWEPQVTIGPGDPCDMNLTPFPPFPGEPNPCVQGLIAAATLNADNAYTLYLDSVRAAFKADYVSRCMGVTESFQVKFVNQQYHFTLYYYDQSGNLVKTVPPAAVRTIATTDLHHVTSARNNGGTYFAEHDIVNGNNYEMLTTKYAYNSLNQPRWQKTPDGGLTEFIYDELGRLSLSQNAKQRSGDHWSYTVYDPLGRITEVGQLHASSGTYTVDQAGSLVSGAIATLLSATQSSHEEITATIYDAEYTGNVLVVQDNLRNRVSYTTYRDAYADPARSATYYSYDIHGNVKILWQENTDVYDPDHQLKRMDYEYDLVSGNVNRMIYQAGEQDQWIHRYSFDTDNRITQVETSRDDVYYDRDASYFYYKHGPLARTELGQLNVQGIDYAYTIHGWLKGINSANLDADLDMGYDAHVSLTNPHRYFGKDVYSFTLYYYDGDYSNISSNTSFVGDVISAPVSYTSLYNGNIAMMGTTLTDNQGIYDPLLSRYHYDQLNRLALADYCPNLDAGNRWDGQFDSRYYNEFSYDANGNILSQFRNGEINNPSMDDLTYYYLAGTNKLDHVEDQFGATYPDDLDSQSSGNYDYDAIGNLIYDKAEEIDQIDWTVYGKVRSVTRDALSTKDELEFSYSPGGHRITKKVIKDNGDEISYYYFYDASGNLMSVYHHISNSETMNLDEQMIYGSSRVGSIKLNDTLTTAVPSPYVYMQKRGQKRYELKNHLDNVLGVISDRRKLHCEEDEWFSADIVSMSDYSPFGAPLKERGWNVGETGRHGFNGQEKDDEVYGEGNAYDFGARMYDPRIGRFLSMDPKSNIYLHLSPYCFAGNSPIQYVDVNGEGPIFYILDENLANQVQAKLAINDFEGVFDLLYNAISDAQANNTPSPVFLMGDAGQGIIEFRGRNIVVDFPYTDKPYEKLNVLGTTIDPLNLNKKESENITATEYASLLLLNEENKVLGSQINGLKADIAMHKKFLQEIINQEMDYADPKSGETLGKVVQSATERIVINQLEGDKKKLEKKVEDNSKKIEGKRSEIEGRKERPDQRTNTPRRKEILD